MLSLIHIFCGRETAIVTIEGMVDRHMMANAVILPMTEMTGSYTPEALIARIRDEVLGFTDMLQVTTMDELMNLVASGFGAILAVSYTHLPGWCSNRTRPP